MSFQDVKLEADSQGLFDLVIDPDNHCFKTVDNLETAVTTSLFTDARAQSSLVPDAIKRRGYLGDINTADAVLRQPLGGLLWTYDQARLDQDTINGLRLNIQESLSWFIIDGIVSKINVDVIQVAEGLQAATELIYVDNTVKRHTQLLRRS